MNDDIGHILDRWKYDRRRTVRKIVGRDGRERIQVRLELGLLQMELDGRPDGKKPYNKESWLDYYELRAARSEQERGALGRFMLNHRDFFRLSEEGLLYYNRYVVLFQMGDYRRTERDTARNLRMFDFVKKYAIDENDGFSLEQYRAYLIRMNRAAHALRRMKMKDYDGALEEIDRAICQISALEDIDLPTAKIEKERSLGILKEMFDKIYEERPPTEKELLVNALDKAVTEERYEDAASIRDRLKELESMRLN